MKISVCMGLYNGAEFIEEQLQSIWNQTKQPDEVILCDDGSTDRTAEIVSRFIRTHNIEDRWKFYCNSINKGYPANFYYACSLCTGDLVFLADQDDVWNSQKIEIMSRIFAEHREAAVVSCKFGLIDEKGTTIHTIMAPTHSHSSGNIRTVNISDVFRKGEWPGMVMAYRRAWYNEWSGESYKIPHDILIAAKAAEERRFIQLDMELAYHRRHGNNAGGEEHRIGRLLNKERKIKEIGEYISILNQFEKAEVLQSEEGKQALQEKKHSMQGRLAALQSKKWRKVIENAIRYRKNTRAATFICDLMIVKGK